MFLKKYLTEIKDLPSETHFYTPLAVHILRGLLNYPVPNCLITKKKEKGIPDLRLFNPERAEWVVGEAKLNDDDIRNAAKRIKIWKEQIVRENYIGPETFYVLLCAPKTFYVCDLTGTLVQGIEISDHHKTLTYLPSKDKNPLTDKVFREGLSRITYEESERLPQYELFRQGRIKGGYLKLTEDTLPKLQGVFETALRELKTYCQEAFNKLRQEYQEAAKEIAATEEDIRITGLIPRREQKLKAKIWRLKRRHQVALQLFQEDGDYEHFKHDQTYAGTKEEKHFEDIFITNTTYVALSRLFFVRICEDEGLTTRKVSHNGPAIWRSFVKEIRDRYQDLLLVAYMDVRHIYSQLFEETVFDWFGRGNSTLHTILERILFQLNAFDFTDLKRELLGTIYQSFRPKAERKRLGEYYTPDAVVDYILAIPPVPWSMDKHVLRRSMAGTLPDAVRLRPKSPLAGDPALELVRGAARHPIDDFVPVAQLADYAVRDAIPRVAGETNSERLWLNVRPYTLNRWLGNATPCDAASIFKGNTEMPERCAEAV